LLGCEVGAVVGTGDKVPVVPTFPCTSPTSVAPSLTLTV
jgi:hypothetical protein